MTLSLRLNGRLASQVESLAKRQGVSKSELIRRCLEEYVARETNRPTAWQVGKDLFGRVGEGPAHLAKDAKRVARERIHAKHRRR